MLFSPDPDHLFSVGVQYWSFRRFFEIKFFSFIFGTVDATNMNPRI